MNNITDYKSQQLFLSRDDEKEMAPLVYYVNESRVQAWPQYPGYRVVAWHAGSGLLVLNSPWIKGARKLVTNLVVMRVATQEVLFSTNRHMYYNAVFDNSGQHLLVEAYNQKPAWINISTGDIVAELKPELRLAVGTFNPHTNTFYFPLEKKKAWLAVDGATFTGIVMKTPYPDRVYKVVYIADLRQYLVLTDGNILLCCDDQLRPIWQRNFSAMGNDAGSIFGSDILVTEDQELVCVSASATAGNEWGADFVLDINTGEPRYILQGYYMRGRIAGSYFGRQVLVHPMKVMGLETGVVTPWTLPDFLPGFK
ncbi:MAG: hypothetical protein J7623_28385 [Chitinophaga sp.]|uniref:hypothetical protein n=1 Tax=Chitinophaga sp. TaxID=1869181 RepID=UPI001B1B2A1F|nr:hypothetical protein [Chitinophaga sp.]MBO9732595.1 hypothetical protein [Chitinophaga sp.]